MRVFEVIAPLDFNIESTGSHHGQQNLRLVAYHNDEEVGYIEYSVWQGEPAVQYIYVYPNKQGNKIGTAMVRRLQAEFPNTELSMGSLTPDGSKLLASIPQEHINDPDYETKTLRLRTLQAKNAEYQKIADEFYTNPTPETRQRLLTVNNDEWNAIHDEISRIEDNIRDDRPSKRIFR